MRYSQPKDTRTMYQSGLMNQSLAQNLRTIGLQINQVNYQIYLQTPIHSSLLGKYIFLSNAGDPIQGIKHARQVLYPCTPLNSYINLSRI